MTGLILPSPSDPPAHDVDEQLELLRVARVELAHAIARLERVSVWSRDPMLTVAERMKLRIARDNRVDAVRRWSDEVVAIEDRLRKMGLHP